MIGVEVRVAGADDAVAGEEAGGPMVGVEPPAAPRVVSQDDIRPQFADRSRHDRPPTEVVLELAVGPAGEHQRARDAQLVGGLTLLDLAPGDQLGRGDVRVPGAL